MNRTMNDVQVLSGSAHEKPLSQKHVHKHMHHLLTSFAHTLNSLVNITKGASLYFANCKNLENRRTERARDRTRCR